MRVDLYTKTMLTIIAACLVWLCLTGTALMPVVTAQTPSAAQQVQLAGWIDAKGQVHLLPSTSDRKDIPLPVDSR